MSSIGVIVNEGKELNGGLEEFRAVLADLGHADPPWHEMPRNADTLSEIEDLVEGEGVERVIVWGGDGTVRRAIHTVVEGGYEEVAIGIMPAGTSNALARNLGIPIDLRQAATIAVTGDPRPIDVGVINDQHFAVRAGIGIGAAVVRDADDDLKGRWGRVGYLWSAVRSVGFGPATVEIDVDGEAWYRGDATAVLLANVGVLLGAVEGFPDASLSDGRLDVGVVRAESRTEWLRLLVRGYVGRAQGSPLTETTTAETVDLTLRRSMPWHVDGGAREPRTRHEVRCIPGAVRIAQPQER